MIDRGCVIVGWACCLLDCRLDVVLVHPASAKSSAAAVSWG